MANEGSQGRGLEEGKMRVEEGEKEGEVGG